MKAGLIGFLFLFSATGASALCQGSDLTETMRSQDPAGFALAEDAAAASPNSEGLLWKVAKDGLAPSYLFGTHHLSGVDENKRARQSRALAITSRLMFVEITPEQENDMQAAFATEPLTFMNSSAQPLSGWLSPDMLRRAETRLAASGINLTIGGVLKPWMVSLLLALPPCMIQARAEGLISMDRELANAAQAADVPVKGLETWRDQIGLFDNAPLEEQRDGVRFQLASELDPEDMLETTAAYYRAEKPMMIWELALMTARREINDRDVDALAAEYFDVLINQRNHNMVAAAREDLSQGGVFVAVGALHLPGEEGLVELLRAEGYEVSRVR